MILKRYYTIVLLVFILFLGLPFWYIHSSQADETVKSSRYTIINGTFLGNEKRNYYGNKAPSALNLIWKLSLGSGRTVVSASKGAVNWSGAGWTGQPLLVEENNKLVLIQGAYDHHLKKIDASNGSLIWQYTYDDVIKGTGTLWLNKQARSSDEELVILQGSRLGVKNAFRVPVIPSFRAISFETGKEFWRLNVKLTDSYSRDVDASALILRDTAYIGLENGIFTVFNPDPSKVESREGMLQPPLYQECLLYEPEDVIAHRRNLVTEASPCLLGGRIYVASGSGHVYGYNLKKCQVDWDFFIGSDMDGSTIVTSDSCILVSVEKQYIPGRGGIYKLDPSRDPKDAVVWFFPTGNRKFATWEGGVIGSAAINDRYRKEGDPYLAVFTAIDGWMYVVDYRQIDTTRKVLGTNNKSLYPTPVLVHKYNTGASISTPIFTEDRIIQAGYEGIKLFSYSPKTLTLLANYAASCESSPVVHNGRLYIASRDGYLYCLGDK
jgi:outer membrane protein assembly factor BamB